MLHPCSPDITRRALRWLCAVLFAVLGLEAAPDGQGAAYLLGVRDVVKVTVWSEASLSGTYTIGAGGAISFPLVGTVEAAGRSTDQLAADLRARLADGFLQNPQVSVEVAEYNSQRIFVVGEVRSPGAVPLTGALTLVEALARVGSMTEMAGGELLVIRPPDGRVGSGPVLQGDTGAREILRLDVKALQARGPTSNVTLLHGDTIIVPRAELIYVTGQVNSPGSYTYNRSMTVLQAISQAGGVNEMGTTRRLKVVRITGGKKVELKASLGDTLQPGDTVVVATRWF